VHEESARFANDSAYAKTYKQILFTFCNIGVILYLEMHKNRGWPARGSSHNHFKGGLGMKKITKLFAGVALSVSLFGATAAAQAACSLTNTGPGSNNTCTVSNTNVVTVTCVNGVNTTNTSVQTATSGTANVSGNSLTGNAASGSTQNINTTANELAQFCLAAAPVTPPVTPPATPPAGGQGGGQVAGAAVTQLPKTGANEVLVGLTVALIGLVGLAGLSQVAVASYRRK